MIQETSDRTELFTHSWNNPSNNNNNNDQNNKIDEKKRHKNKIINSAWKRQFLHVYTIYNILFGLSQAATRNESRTPSKCTECRQREPTENNKRLWIAFITLDFDDERQSHSKCQLLNLFLDNPTNQRQTHRWNIQRPNLKHPFNAWSSVILSLLSIKSPTLCCFSFQLKNMCSSVTNKLINFGACRKKIHQFSNGNPQETSK